VKNKTIGNRFVKYDFRGTVLHPGFEGLKVGRKGALNILSVISDELSDVIAISQYMAVHHWQKLAPGCCHPPPPPDNEVYSAVTVSNSDSTAYFIIRSDLMP
jgi:hypothetical protein